MIIIIISCHNIYIYDIAEYIFIIYKFNGYIYLTKKMISKYDLFLLLYRIKLSIFYLFNIFLQLKNYFFEEVYMEQFFAIFIDSNNVKENRFPMIKRFWTLEQQKILSMCRNNKDIIFFVYYFK